MNTRILTKSYETNDKSIQLNLWGIWAWIFELWELSLKSVAISPKTKQNQNFWREKLWPNPFSSNTWISVVKKYWYCVLLFCFFIPFTSINTENWCVGCVRLLYHLVAQKCEITCAYKSRTWTSMFNWFVILSVFKI